MPNGHGCEVRQDSHHLSVVLVECRGTAMSHDEDGSPGVLHLPRKENAVGHKRGLNSHDVEEALPDAKELWLAAFQTDAAGAGIAWKHRVQEPVVLTGRCHPVVIVRVTLFFGFEADACAVGTAQVYCCIDQLLQDRIGTLHETVREPA